MEVVQNLKWWWYADGTRVNSEVVLGNGGRIKCFLMHYLQPDRICHLKCGLQSNVQKASNTFKHSHKHTLPLTHTHTCPHTNILTYTPTPYTHSHTHTHTHSHALWLRLLHSIIICTWVRTICFYHKRRKRFAFINSWASHQNTHTHTHTHTHTFNTLEAKIERA